MIICTFNCALITGDEFDIGQEHINRTECDQCDQQTNVTSAEITSLMFWVKM